MMKVFCELRPTCTGWAAACDRPPTTRFSDAPRPTANVTVSAPSKMATRVTAVRAGRANGAASPIVTGRGSGSRLRIRCAV